MASFVVFVTGPNFASASYKLIEGVGALFWAVFAWIFRYDLLGHSIQAGSEIVTEFPFAHLITWNVKSPKFPHKM